MVSAAPPAQTVATLDALEETRAVSGRWARLFARLAARYPRLVPFAWLLVMVFWAGSLALAWFCWFIMLPGLWSDDRGISILTNLSAAGLLHIGGALVGSVFLLLIPVWGWMLAYGMTSAAFEATVGDEHEDVAALRERVRETEDDALARLETTDAAGLLPLLRYSRAQLEAYYAMGLRQTSRAFLNAALAMWLGFLLLVAGIAMYIGPVEKFGLARPAGDLHWMVLAAAVIIEAISALFLWVYRSTIGQLTFYYRLQMQGHTAIMCYRIADTMKDADPAKRAVIDKLLGATLDPERPEPMTGAGVAKLVTGA